MFDGCDEHATLIVDTALAEARQLGHNYLGSEHLLIALSRHRTLLPPAVGELMPSPDDLVARVVREVGAPSQRDVELLRVVGIDLDEVRVAVRRTFGDDVVDELARRRVHQPWQPWRRPSRRCTSLLAGTMSVAPRLKKALELGRRKAERLAGTITPADLLLGMIEVEIEVEDAMSSQLLADAGVDPSALRRRLAG